MPPRKEPREVGGDVGESSISNPAEQVEEDTFLRDLIPPKGVFTLRDNVEAPVEAGEGSAELALNCLLQSAFRATIATLPQPIPQAVVQVKETPAQKRLKLITGFSKLMPVMFEGGADPMVADDYMDQAETHLTSMEVTDDHLKIILATYKFSKDAKLWWKSVTNQHKIEEMSWEMFKELFYKKYFWVTKRWELREQFNGLIQGNMSVTEYENKFISLFCFAPELVRNEVNKTRKFIFDLDYKMRPLIMAQYFKVYLEAIERALMFEAEAKDRNAGKEQWKQKRNAGPSSERPSWKRNRGSSSQFQGQQSARSAPTTPVPAGSDKSGVICYQCQQPGHYKSKCPMNLSRACYGCNQQGHMIRDCLN
ncbi:uncharacterized protein LOC132281974 [Cornus florida]|uniref:uncharacterized protein LOC132281974 n=1 Tax=Cornus florida TaxID=4283 RepID=UPI00289C9B56|nr:uncharacterized protein LOC132281974 [Cornus florida]